MNLRTALIAAWLVLPVTLTAEPPALVERALANMDSADIDEWSYTVTTSRSGRKTVERHDATRPEGSRWQLVLKGGEPPTSDEIAEYLAAKRDQSERRKRRGRDEHESEVSEMVDLSSLTLLAEDSSHATYSFRMKVDEEGQDFADHVEGTLVVEKTLPHVERLEMRSTDEIKPVAGVKISEFHVLMRFDHDVATGAILPRTIETTLKGRAFLVKSLDEDIEVSFTDYRRPKR